MSYINGSVEMFLLLFCRMSSFAKYKANCSAIINNGVMVLNLKSVVPIKTRSVQGKRRSALHKYIMLMSMSKTTTGSNSVLNSTYLKLSPFE